MNDINDLGLPAYRVRPLVPQDAEAVYELMAAGEVEATGEIHIEPADIVSDWQRPSFDLATQSIGVFDADALVGYAEVVHGRRADAAVAATHRGRGIGTALARWTQRISVRDGSGLVGMPQPVGSAGEKLLRSLGYRVLWTSWLLAMPAGTTVEPQPLPAGYEIVTAADESELRQVHGVIEDAFLEWAQRERESFEDFLAATVQRPGYEPWNVRAVRDGSGAIVGASVVLLSGEVGYVDRLAVRKDQRGRGLARALLADAFAQADAHGATRSELNTDTRTGALGLYQRVGMRVTNTWQHWVYQS